MRGMIRARIVYHHRRRIFCRARSLSIIKMELGLRNLPSWRSPKNLGRSPWKEKTPPSLTGPCHLRRVSLVRTRKILWRRGDTAMMPSCTNPSHSSPLKCSMHTQSSRLNPVSIQNASSTRPVIQNAPNCSTKCFVNPSSYLCAHSTAYLLPLRRRHPPSPARMALPWPLLSSDVWPEHATR